MNKVEKIKLIAGQGIKGDINANSMSPRQILVVRNEDIAELSILPGELRENMVISGVNPEKFTPGSVLTFDSGAAIRLTFHCEPCKRIAHLVDSLKSIQKKRGILGVVINSGVVNIGNSVSIQTEQFPALSDNPYQRFLDFIVKLPAGKVITYKHILEAIGLDKSYLRAIPIYIQKTSADNYPIHRILDSQGYLIKYVTNQKNKLKAEGIPILDNLDLSSGLVKYFVEDSQYFYQNQELYLN